MKKVPLNHGKSVETPWLNSDEAAAYCGVSRDYFDKKVKEANLEHGGSCSKKLFRTTVLDRFIQNGFQPIPSVPVANPPG